MFTSPLLDRQIWADRIRSVSDSLMHAFDMICLAITTTINQAGGNIKHCSVENYSKADASILRMENTALH
jgi:hypothetical protein